MFKLNKKKMREEIEFTRKVFVIATYTGIILDGAVSISNGKIIRGTAAVATGIGMLAVSIILDSLEVK